MHTHPESRSIPYSDCQMDCYILQEFHITASVRLIQKFADIDNLTLYWQRHRNASVNIIKYYDKTHWQMHRISGNHYTALCNSGLLNILRYTVLTQLCYCLHMNCQPRRDCSLQSTLSIVHNNEPMQTPCLLLNEVQTKTNFCTFINWNWNQNNYKMKTK